MLARLFSALLLVLMALPVSLLAAQSPVQLSDATLAQLRSSELGVAQTVASFPVAVGRNAAVSFERIEVYAPGAKLIEVTPTGQRELPRSTDIHLIGRSADGRARIALSLDASGRAAPRGAGYAVDGNFALQVEKSANGWSITAIEPAAALPPGVVPHYVANNDTLIGPDSGASPLEGLQASLQPQPSASTPARIAVLAVDTDASFMSKRFNDNSANATTWIADLFVQMNVIYRRDLDVILQQGTTFLRPGSDPFANADGSATQAQLLEFGTYWQNNYSSGANAVSRSFAVLLSGNSSAQNSASGIAWLNSYCRTTASGGSYSTNQIFTNPGIPIASSNFIVAHELGHNFGAHHSHCSNSTTGIGPASSNTIDQCFNGEANQGCYGGAQICPAGGRGSLMSYCHVGACSGTSNLLEFAPAHITRIRGLINTNSPSCLRSETLYTTGFDS